MGGGLFELPVGILELPVGVLELLVGILELLVDVLELLLGVLEPPTQVVASPLVFENLSIQGRDLLLHFFTLLFGLLAFLIYDDILFFEPFELKVLEFVPLFDCRKIDLNFLEGPTHASELYVSIGVVEG